jgi:imidazolonepropionase-like amidohydrolase
MTSFVNIKYSTQHPGVVRAESAFGAVRQLGQAFSGTRGLATLLLSAVAAAIMVVAYQVMDSVTEGHLLVMWIALWAVAFAALAIFAGTARNLAARVKAGLDGWSRSMAEARADQRLWQAAKSDPRVMADLQMALQRSADAEVVAPAAPAVMAELPPSSSIPSLARAYHRGYYI